MDRRALFSLAPAAVGLLAAAAAAPARASSEGGESKAVDAYVRFPTVTATIVRPDGRNGVMTVETGINIQDPALRIRAQQEAPRLRAAYNSVVHLAGTRLRPGAAPDIEQLHRDLQAATNATLRRSGATLLLGTVMVV